MAYVSTPEDRIELDRLSDMAYRLAGQSGTVQDDLVALRDAFTGLFVKFPNLAKNYVETVRMRKRNIFPRQFVIGDVEPMGESADFLRLTSDGWDAEGPDPLALDYVVGDGPRDPVWRKKAPIWSEIDYQARAEAYARTFPNFYGEPGQCVGRRPNPGEVIL